MRIARISVGGEVTFAVMAEDGASELAGHPFSRHELSGRQWPFGEFRLLAPVLPSKVVAVATNYRDHAAEMGSGVRDEPMIFLKPSTSVIGPGDSIALPPQSKRVDYEAELAVVIGRLCRDVPAARAAGVILGYTAANDVTARDLQKTDGQWARAKGFDTFCPLGPWIETELDLTSDDHPDLAVGCSVNGHIKQQGSTGDMVHSVADLIAFISAAMTLLPGDVILTGTPAGIGPLYVGDEVEVKISGIGPLFNPVTNRA